MIFKRYSANPYAGKVNILICKSLNQAASKLEDLYDHRFDVDANLDEAITFEHTGKNGGMVVTMVFRPGARPGVIAHECLHALNIIYAYNGVKHSLRNDEGSCYYLAELVDRVHRAQAQYKKNFGK